MIHASDMPRTREQLVDDNVRIVAENVRLRGALGDLLDALRDGLEPPPELIERAEIALGRRRP